MILETVNKGVIILNREGQAWGIVYQDGQVTSYGWTDPERVELRDPTYLTKPEDATYSGSHDARTLREEGRIIQCTRTIKTEIFV